MLKVFDSDSAALEEGNHLPESTEDNKDERRPVFRNATFQVIFNVISVMLEIFGSS